MKKILIVADTYFPKIDGIMRTLREVVPRIAQDFEITLLVPDWGISWDYNEIKIKTSRIIRLSGYASMSFSWSNIQNIREAVRNTDIVFIQGPALMSLLAIYFGRRYNKTVVYYIHLIMWELYEKNIPRWLGWFTIPILKKLTVAWYNACDVLVVPYRNLIMEMTKSGIRTKKEVARLGVDTLAFYPAADKDEAKRRLGIDPSYRVVGYIGRISKEKNVGVLLEAVKNVQENEKILLLVVGSGTKSEMKKFRNAKNTMLPGFIEDVTPYYQAMDIFVMPSLTETTSLATLEAMACGIPVITTKVGFLKEYVMKNFNGLLFPKGNVLTLTIQLRKLLRRKKMRRRMGKNAREVALGFSWDKTAARMREILRKY